VYRAINRVIGEPNELIEFSIQAVTEGIDAVGRVTIRIQAGDPVRDNGHERRVFSGRASDTDIVVASAKAYMFALNRLIAARREAEVPSVSFGAGPTGSAPFGSSPGKVGEQGAAEDGDARRSREVP
jgi:hypothetical protein